MKKNLYYVISILSCLFLILIFIEIKDIKNNLNDTFYATDISFERGKGVSFFLYTSSKKTYENNCLTVHFKCYDKNGIMKDYLVDVKKPDFFLG